VSAPFIVPGRDAYARRGRAKAAGTTFYHVPGVTLSSTSTWAPIANFDYYAPFFVETPTVVDSMACEVTTGGAGNFRMGFYAADTDWQPIGAPLADSGSISGVATGVKTYAPGTPVALPRGRYLTVFNGDTALVTYRRFDGNPPGSPLHPSFTSTPFLSIYGVSRAFAAFPTPGTAWTDTSATLSTAHRYIAILRTSAP
jgi:hypothetical protein